MNSFAESLTDLMKQVDYFDQMRVLMSFLLDQEIPENDLKDILRFLYKTIDNISCEMKADVMTLEMCCVSEMKED